MKSRDAVGKKIVRIEQTRTADNIGETVWHIDAIVLEDGTKLCPNVLETDIGEYLVEMTVYKRKRGDDDEE